MLVRTLLASTALRLLRRIVLPQAHSSRQNPTTGLWSCLCTCQPRLGLCARTGLFVKPHHQVLERVCCVFTSVYVGALLCVQVAVLLAPVAYVTHMDSLPMNALAALETDAVSEAGPHFLTCNEHSHWLCSWCRLAVLCLRYA
jgi:hypothetical protein